MSIIMGTFTLDGIALDDPAGRWALSSATKLRLSVPAPVLSSVKIPGVHGVVPAPPQIRDAGSQTIGLVVTDNASNGTATGNHQQVRINVARLLASAAPLGRLPILRYFPDGNTASPTWQEAPVRLLAAVDPDDADPFTVNLVLPFDVPGVFWNENVEHELVSASTSNWAVGSPAQLLGTTGTIVAPSFICAGPLTNVVVTDNVLGKKLTWAGALTAGQFLRLDPATYKATRHTAVDWTGAGTDVSGGLSTGPNGFDLASNATHNVGWGLVRTGGAGINYARARRAFL